MSNPVGAIPANKADLDDLAFRARAKIAELKAAGQWHGGLAPHPYQKKPLEWIVEKLGVPESTLRWSMNPGYEKHAWDADQDPMIKILHALAEGKDVCCESCTGSGKTFLAACVILWFTACHENSLVVSTAPKEAQLLTQVWKEIAGLWGRFKQHFPGAELLPGSGEIRMRQGDEKATWTAMAFVAGVGADEDTAAKAAGFHRAHFLIVSEDTQGLDPALMSAFAHTRTDDHNLHLALGNPDSRNDSLHRFGFNEKEEPRDGVVHVRISALDHPNIVSGPNANGDSPVPGAIGRRRLAVRAQEYGGPGSRFYESRIRGICPAEAEDSLIQWQWCLDAAKNSEDAAYKLGKRALGVDPSNSDRGDPASISYWEGACCTKVEAFPCPDAGELGERVVRIARDPLRPIEEENVGVDEVGVGASTVNAAKALRFKVRRLGGATKPIPRIDVDEQWSYVQPNDFGGMKPAGPRVIEAERYSSLRSQILWTLREDLRHGKIALPYDPELFQDLCTPKYTTKNGLIVVEAKEEIKKRLPDRRSPNKGDACAYGNFVRDRSLPMPSREAIPASTRQRDYQLERLLSRHEKQEKKETARVNRMLARHGRERIRAMKRERDG